MKYPLISEYVESVLIAEDNFATLTNLRPVLDDNGRPVMSCGNFAVVFKMQEIIKVSSWRTERKYYALKCFIKDQIGRENAYESITNYLQNIHSNYIVPFQYIPNEIYVDTKTNDKEFPVVLMDWVEGESLEHYLNSNILTPIEYTYLFNSFYQLANWLIHQDFAHGDIKPDNIIIRKDGSFALVDYDGIFVPSMYGKPARENGSPDYTYPFKTTNDFDSNLDVFALAVLLLKIRCKIVFPEIDVDDFGYDDFVSITSSLFIKNIYPSTDKIINFIVGAIINALIEQNYAKVTDVIKKILPDVESIVSRESVLNQGLKLKNISYSYIEEDNEYRRSNFPHKSLFGCLLEGLDFMCFGIDGPTGEPNEVSWEHIVIPSSLYAISDQAFVHNKFVESIEIPSTVKYIGKYSFCDCPRLRYIIFRSVPSFIDAKIFDGNPWIFIPDGTKKYFLDFGITGDFLYEYTEWINSNNSGVTQIDKEMCISMGNYVLSPNKKRIIKYIGDEKSINIPDYVTTICDKAFYGCSNLTSVKLPFGIECIGENAFFNCEQLTNVTIPSSLKAISPNTFGQCYNLCEVIISEGVERIERLAFGYCKSLKQVTIPDSVIELGDSSFQGCEKLNRLKLSSKLQLIGNECFSRAGIVNIDIPITVKEIGKSAFSDCKYLQAIHLPENLRSIKERTFDGCSSLSSINIPYMLESIDKEAFKGCISNQLRIKFNVNLKNIGFNAFEDLLPKNIDVENSTFDKDEYALYSNGKKNLIAVLKKTGVYDIPSTVKTIKTNSFYNCNFDTIEIPSSVENIEVQAFCRGHINNIILRNRINISPGSFYPCVRNIKVYSNDFKFYDDILSQPFVLPLSLCHYFSRKERLEMNRHLTLLTERK